MSGGRSVVLRHLQTWIARGYRPTTGWYRATEYVPGATLPGGTPSGWAAALPAGAVRIGLVAPTHVARAGLADQQRDIQGLLARLVEVRAAHPGVVLVFFVGMQWFGVDQRDEALRRLRALVALADGYDGIHAVGLALQGPGKVGTLNAAIRVAEVLGLTGLGWIDDDVVLEPHCMQRMIRDFLARGCRGAVGATKIPHAREFVTSRLLHRAKAIAAPATNYPHGCCILVALDVIAGGIPDRYVCDDGYVCFRLLAPQDPDPLRDLRLVPDALCHYHVAGPAGQTRRRIRRLLLDHLIYLADWPLPVSRYYFQRVLFHGMWPLAGWDASRGWRIGMAKAGIKWLYFAWFARVAAELYLRGILGRPLRQVQWSGYARPVMPVLPADKDQPEVREAAP
jgi:hypothetical protein